MNGHTVMLTDFPQLDTAETDRADRLLARQKRQEEMTRAKAIFRQHAENEAAKDRLDALMLMLGPEPTTGEGWIERGLKALELSQVQGVGLEPRAAVAYEQACRARAAFIEPAKYGNKPNQVVVLDVASLLDQAAARVRRLAGEPSEVLEGEIIPPSSAA